MELNFGEAVAVAMARTQGTCMRIMLKDEYKFDCWVIYVNLIKFALKVSEVMRSHEQGSI